MWAIADDITDEAAIRAKAEDILNTFDIEGGGTVEKVWDMAKYVVAYRAGSYRFHEHADRYHHLCDCRSGHVSGCLY